MFNRVLIALAVASLAYVGFLILKAYKPQWFAFVKAGFQDKPKMAIVVAKEPEPTPGPAPAPPIKADPPPPEKVVTPAGPNPPNQKVAVEASVSPDAQPIDPYESNEMQAPIHDTLSHPELSFGPGVEQKGTGRPGAGLASTTVSAPLATFSPEYAQNGGSFMGSVFANDLQPGDDYATA
jgi:hypothetical protein